MPDVTDYSLFTNKALLVAHKVFSESIRVNEALENIPSEKHNAARPEFINVWKRDFVLVERELMARLTQFDDVCNELVNKKHPLCTPDEARQLIAEEIYDGIVSQNGRKKKEIMPDHSIGCRCRRCE